MSIHRVIVILLLITVGGCGGIGATDGSTDDPPGSDAPVVGGYGSEPAEIYVDGKHKDWNAIPVRQEDVGDGQGLGIERLWLAHTDQYLFFRIELDQSVNLQEGNDLTLHLDVDNDPSTGAQNLGLGAELLWRFGERKGEYEGGEIRHADIGLQSLPTVTARTFEIAIDRSKQINGTRLFQGDSLRVGLTTEGDRVPDEQGGLGYVLSSPDLSIDAPDLERPASSDLRIMTQNSVNDFDEGRSAIFESERQPSYRRIFDAVGPDVIAFQEIYDQTAEQVSDVTSEELGLSQEWTWRKRGQDLVLGSRYPIQDVYTIPGYQENESGAFLLDTKDVLGHPLIVVVMHPPCCNFPANEDGPSRNAQRQQVVDGVAAFLRDVTRGEGPFGVDERTPIAVVGDMNFVGEAQQPRTLRTGEIVNTDTYGDGGPPDWDGSELLDTNPQQVHAPLHTTWISSESSFPPGRLDYAFVTDSVLEVVHEFTLNTAVLSSEQRGEYNLQSDDTATASDHLPVVIDVTTKE